MHKSSWWFGNLSPSHRFWIWKYSGYFQKRGFSELSSLSLSLSTSLSPRISLTSISISGLIFSNPITFIAISFSFSFSFSLNRSLSNIWAFRGKKTLTLGVDFGFFNYYYYAFFFFWFWSVNTHTVIKSFPLSLQPGIDPWLVMRKGWATSGLADFRVFS